jgi:rhodanese-related sulfurtransferase
MTKHFFPFLLFLFSFPLLFGQRTIEKTLEKLNNNSIPYISAEALKTEKNNVILDTREKKEFNVSHLKNAIWVGYHNFNLEALTIKDKNTPIVVYCSIGVRSEDIGEKLAANGFTNVKNLYGGIFKWVENDYPIFDAQGNSTNRVHTFTKYWGKLLTKGEKVNH